ncbi:hypothetical protein HOL34_01990 [bacterium]|jgi:hypothetical protein|nr:hypothetical protein [bacterium]MBT3903375.1 hypothetical protein [bacterium]MBT4577682.1 hypothetical protein [bacterium]MBT5345842.1 hypothetical protein [bacterium]MBT6130821.1 hypothetical protein [bacterium]
MKKLILVAILNLVPYSLHSVLPPRPKYPYSQTHICLQPQTSSRMFHSTSRNRYQTRDKFAQELSQWKVKLDTSGLLKYQEDDNQKGKKEHYTLWDPPKTKLTNRNGSEICLICRYWYLPEILLSAQLLDEFQESKQLEKFRNLSQLPWYANYPLKINNSRKGLTNRLTGLQKDFPKLKTFSIPAEYPKKLSDDQLKTLRKQCATLYNSGINKLVQIYSSKTTQEN